MYIYIFVLKIYSLDSASPMPSFCNVPGSSASRSLAKQLRRGWKAVACVAQLSNAIITERRNGCAVVMVVMKPGCV